MKVAGTTLRNVKSPLDHLDLGPLPYRIAPGGGIAPEGKSWVSCKPGFFLPVRVLSRLFRSLFCERLEHAHRSGKLAYLARYSHRVAIANSRLVRKDGATGTFRYKDYRAKGRSHQKHMSLDAHEFIRRFLIHTLPPLGDALHRLPAMNRIRHYGLFANTTSPAPETCSKPQCPRKITGRATVRSRRPRNAHTARTA